MLCYLIYIPLHLQKLVFTTMFMKNNSTSSILFLAVHIFRVGLFCFLIYIPLYPQKSSRSLLIYISCLFLPTSTLTLHSRGPIVMTYLHAPLWSPLPTTPILLVSTTKSYYFYTLYTSSLLCLLLLYPYL